MFLLTRTDVTAVKFHKNLVLAGMGSAINIFNKKSTKILQRLGGLHGQKIYGFVPGQCGDKILVFGGKQFTVVSTDFSVQPEEGHEVYFRVFVPVVCDDWLHSAVWISDDVVALLTAHNVVQKWDTITQTLISQHPSSDNSILYSGLLLPLQDDVLVMAGTVFSEVIIHKCSGKQPLHHLKGHKGVIFSISCEPRRDIIVTTSDDRSVRIWGVVNKLAHRYNTSQYWEDVTIVCKHEVYAHLARVMRSCITNNVIVSVGEDSAICYWNYSGKLLKKAITHQNGCIIWSVDTDGTSVVTGGGDGGLILHPLTVATDYCCDEIIEFDDIIKPTKLMFTARMNLLIMDTKKLIYYDVPSKNKIEYKLDHDTTYNMMSLSSCKQLIAVADMQGKLDIFLETCKGPAFISNVLNTTLQLGKIKSTQWGRNRHLVFCDVHGKITVFAVSNMNLVFHTIFYLPTSKDLAALNIDSVNNNFIVGDKSGSIHVFVKGQTQPVQSFHKVHGKYGPTSVNIRNDSISTTGRDGTIKYFCTNNNDVKYMSSKDLPFDWVEKFLDKDENIVCGFKEIVFVVYNVKDNSKILEVTCGGGHRSWDVLRYFEKVHGNYEEFIKFIYLRRSEIHVTTVQLSKVLSRNLINGSHAKEINCLKTCRVGDATVYISGGEDTTLRISSVDKVMNFRDEVSFKHLSSIKTLKIYPLVDNHLLVLSAGGRAQICIKDIILSQNNSEINVITEDIIDYLIKGTDKERKGNQSWLDCSIDYDPEMRILDLDLIKGKDTFLIFAGCSDSYLRVFLFNKNSKTFELIKASNYHKTCILKTKCIKILNKDILITCTTRGDVTLWDLTDIVDCNLEPFFSTKTNKSGINSIVTTILSENKILISTGGDDNAIHIIVLEIPNTNDLTSTTVLHTSNSSNYHSSQITGLCSVDDYLLSTSIDKRITLLKWWISEEGIQCKFLSQIYTNVADVHGMELVHHNRDSITVCVFGKGMEVVVVPKVG